MMNSPSTSETETKNKALGFLKDFLSRAKYRDAFVWYDESKLETHIHISAELREENDVFEFMSLLSIKSVSESKYQSLKCGLQEFVPMLGCTTTTGKKERESLSRNSRQHSPRAKTVKRSGQTTSQQSGQV